MRVTDLEQIKEAPPVSLNCAAVQPFVHSCSKFLVTGVVFHQLNAVHIPGRVSLLVLEDGKLKPCPIALGSVINLALIA